MSGPASPPAQGSIIGAVGTASAGAAVDEVTVRRIVTAIEPLLDGTGERLDPTHAEADYAGALSEIIAALAELDPSPFPLRRG